MIDYRLANHDLSAAAATLCDLVANRHGNSQFSLPDMSYDPGLIHELVDGGFLCSKGNGMYSHTGKQMIAVPGYGRQRQ